MQGKGEQTTYWLINEDPVQKSERNIIRNRLLSNSGLGEECSGSFLRASPISAGSGNGSLLPHHQYVHRLSNHSNSSNRSYRNKCSGANAPDAGDLDRSSVRSDAIAYDLFHSSENASLRRDSSRKSFILGIDSLFRRGTPPQNSIFNSGITGEPRPKWGFKSEFSKGNPQSGKLRATSKNVSPSDRYLKVPFSTKASSFKCSPTSSAESYSAASLQRNSLPGVCTVDENSSVGPRNKTMSSKIGFKDLGANADISEVESPLL